MKINLKVHAEFDIDGSIRPTSIVWEDGRVFAVDRILDIRRAASLKAGGMGMYSPGGQSESRRNGYAVHLSDLWQGR